MVISRFLILILCFIVLPVTALAKVSAHLDRSTIEEGETFQLMLQSDGEEPDLKSLEPFFEVVGTSRSSKVSIINGTVNRVAEWIITLAPKNMGAQSIPPIRFGSESTAPMAINVIKPVATEAKQGADIFLEAKVDQPKVYVQSQIIFSIRLYRAVEIREASLTEPIFDNAVVERIGEDVNFQTQRNQRRYSVTERRYAVFPQQSGELQIPEVVFQGLVLEPMGNQSSNDPFNRFFQTQPTKRVRIKSESLVVAVEPQPASYTGEHWLPSKRMTLSEIWTPEKPEFKVGEPVTRTLRIEALGLTGSQLPEIKLFDAHGIKNYTDQPHVETQVKGDDLLAIREEKFAIIPTSSGKLVLPEIRLTWWDTEYNSEKTLNIPPRIIDVAPAAATTQVQLPIQADEIKTPAESKVESQKTVLKSVIDPGYWPYATAAFAFAWLVTLVVSFLLWRKNANTTAQTVKESIRVDVVSSNKALAELKKACNDNRPDSAKLAILNWAAATWPERPPRNLSQIAENIRDSTVSQAFADLDQLLYRNDGAVWNGMTFWESVSSRMRKSKSSEKKNNKSLPDLYPQRV